LATQYASPSVDLSIALSDYDHVRDLVCGDVDVEGVSLICMRLTVEEIFFRFTRFREWDVSELSMAKYCALRGAGDNSLIAIPVFPSRSFRHSAIYIRPDGPREDPGSLAGARIGFPEWTVTATVYARALLQHEFGVDLTGVRWVQGGTNEAGRIETLPVELPNGINVEPVVDRTLNEMLIAGDIDAIIAPHPPAGFTDGSGDVVRLFADYRAAEEDYYQRTGVFPIMHVLAIQRDVYERNRWIAMNLYSAFDEAKRRSQARAIDAKAPSFPVPWGPANAERAQALVGDDFWPYGVEPNRATLEAFAEYVHEQRVTTRKLHLDELFAPETLQTFRV